MLPAHDVFFGTKWARWPKRTVCVVPIVIHIRKLPGLREEEKEEVEKISPNDHQKSFTNNKT